MALIEKKCITLVSLFLLVSCDIFEYSPHQIDGDVIPHNFNMQQISDLQNRHANQDTLQIAVISDTHFDLDETKEFVSTINRHNMQSTSKSAKIHAVFCLGDFSKYGLLFEYEHYYKL